MLMWIFEFFANLMLYGVKMGLAIAGILIVLVLLIVL